ncbi:hypothetical protein RJ639_038302 [Escallonia herrerae]|uniref:Uncharacterized protein n=1 Tax=Escallonia herrerae TaxID=1293975 RepID=A0AA89BFP8_9ASTE|nr:hypothetical protein RJ639_038302 [Escallonia herrerae]
MKDYAVFPASQSVKKIIKIDPYMLGTMAEADCQFWHRNLGINGTVSDMTIEDTTELARRSIYHFTMLDQVDRRSYVVMTLENFTMCTIQLNQLSLSRRYPKFDFLCNSV